MAYLRSHGTPKAINPFGDVTETGTQTLSNKTLSSVTMPAGHIISVKENSGAAAVYTDSGSWTATGLSVTITPASSSSIFWCHVHHIWHFNTATNGRSTARLFRDSTESNAWTSGILVSDWTTMDHWYQTSPTTNSGIDSPATASEIVYTVKFAAHTGQGTAYFHVGDHYATGVSNEPCTLTVVEFSGLTS